MQVARTILGSAAAATLAVGGLATTPPASADDHHGHHHGTGSLTTVADGLDGPRGVDVLGHGRTLVTETDGTFSLVVEHRTGPATVTRLGQLPSEFAPAVSAGPHRTVWLLTGGAEPGSPAAEGAATLYRWRPG